ncbi:MAG: type VI secretion system ATPase TssH [Acidobacteriota bacterium]
MITQDVRGLLQKANSHLTEALEGALGFTNLRTHYEVTLEHLLLKLLENGQGDLPLILRHFDVEPGELETRFLHALEDLQRGNGSQPRLSPLLLDALETGFLVGSLEYGEVEIRSGALLAAALGDQGSGLYPYLGLLGNIQLDVLRREFPDIVANSVENRRPTGRFGPGRQMAAAEDGPAPETPALDQFTLDFTAAARNGEIDPVYGRDVEIRQMIDILSRRRKNNPILVGEAGVGKTALVEGLALRVASGDVPQVLAGVEIRSLDLGLLQAGAGVKGEFENRLKSVIAEIKESPTPIVTFIDEAHTLIGAGGSAGQGDAANLLKPALARGELRTLAATTWSEYKKYFEKDAALARRFQLVKVDEPDEERALIMMRGIKSKFEDAHEVRILDDATVASVELAERFIAGRQLPDKSVDLLDTAAARVKIALTSKPAPIEDLERRIENATIARNALVRDLEGGSPVETNDIEQLDAEITGAKDELETLRQRWEAERDAVHAVLAARGEQIASEEGATDTAAEAEADEAASETDSEPGDAETGEIEGEAATEKSEVADVAPEDLDAALAKLEAVRGDDSLIPLEVTADVIAAVVSDWTGIPAGKMLRDQAQAVLDLETRLGERVLGQEPAIAAVAERLRAAHAGLGNPNTPQGVFLLVGPSGIGKTETGLALADLLFGGERFMTTVNMSEYMESHTVSRLIGSPPGYVGFGEGGILTEAIRQRPYSVVLLDEVEKSHPDVMNLFYQVFDKGTLADGEGREIDCKNTVIIMTSNLASDDIVEMCAGDVEPEADELVEAIRPALRERFKPALLARMTIVPYVTLGPEVLRRIVDLKLGQIVDRLQQGPGIELGYTQDVAEWIAERCTVEETGARNIDHIIQSDVLPGVSTEILERMARGEPIASIQLDLDADDRLTHEFE